MLKSCTNSTDLFEMSSWIQHATSVKECAERRARKVRREPIAKLTFKIYFLVLVFGDPCLVFPFHYLIISLGGKINRGFWCSV